jgi:replication factor A1
MIGMNYDEIAKILSEKSGAERGEIDKRVNDKMLQLSGLISREGAAHIIANEMKIKVFEDFIKNLKVGKLVPGMGSVDFSAKVVRTYGVREFKTERREGKVASFLAGDETGMIRIVLWDTNHIQEMESGRLTEGAVIRVENAYVKENNGFPEVHLGNKGVLITGVNEKIGEVGSEKSKTLKKISELEQGDNTDIAGTIVQVFDPRTYESCPECGRKVNLDGGSYICSTHGKVEKKESKVLNFYLDDGTSNIRVVSFGKVANELLKSENLEQIKDDVLGMQVRVKGRAVKNSAGDRIEFSANSISKVSSEEISKELIKEIDA